MARKQLSYSELRVALFVVAAVVLLIVGIFYVTGQTAWQPRYRLKTYLPEAEQVVAGAPVSLGGVTVGSVTRLRINPNATTPGQNIEVDMDVFKRYQKWIRENSTATLVTQGALGSRYVTVTRGTPPAPVIPSGGVVRGVSSSTLETMESTGAVLADNLDALETNFRQIGKEINSGHGTLGKFLHDPSLRNRLSDTEDRTDALIAKIRRGRGTIGKFETSDQLRDRANSAVTRANALLDTVKARKGSLGNLMYDPAFRDNAQVFLKHGKALLTNVEAGKGSLGKFVKDRSLENDLGDASLNVRELAAKMNHGPASEDKFFTNPRLYDHLDLLTGDLRSLIEEFRKDPKKYLRIQFSIF